MEYAKHTGRMGMKNNSGSGGDIIQVEGGHIVRSVGRKDRHSKVFTAKGPRDRRVRLSAHTAIQFYDVQDRLGYDRPSKAVDWLIKKAKSAIDKLAQLPPPYIPHATTDHQEDDDPNASTQQQETGMAVEESETPAYNNNFETYAAIEDTMKSFFPITSSTTNNPCINNFQNYPSQTEDLCLSLHSFPDQQALFTGSTSAPPQVGFHEANNYNQGTMAMVAASWNRERAREHEEEEEQGGFVFHSSQPLLDGFGPNMRGTLQSNFAPANSSASTFFTWNDLSIASEKNQRISSTSHDNQIHQSSIFGTRFSTDGYLGFNIPGRIGEDHENERVTRPRKR